MHRESTIRDHAATAAAIALALSLTAFPTLTQANDWGAAEATSGQMDDHKATSEDPDEMTVGSETMNGRMAESENPASMVTGAGRLNEHEGLSTDLTDLKTASPDAGFEDIEVPGQSEWGTTTDPEVLVARKYLVRAQQRARNARTVYGDMVERNYPRGAARIQIVDERDASMKAIEEAKSALAGAES